MKPYQTAKVEGEKLAKQYANLETVSQVDIFNGLESYYSVLGQDKNQKPVAVLIEKSNNKYLRISTRKWYFTRKSRSSC